MSVSLEMWTQTNSPQRSRSSQYKSILCFGHLWKYCLKSLNFTATAIPLKFPFQKSMPGSRTDILLNHYQVSDTRKFKLIKYSYVSSRVLHLSHATSVKKHTIKQYLLWNRHGQVYTCLVHLTFLVQSLIKSSCTSINQNILLLHNLLKFYRIRGTVHADNSLKSFNFTDIHIEAFHPSKKLKRIN